MSKRGKESEVKETHPIVQKKIKKTLDLSVKESVFSSAATGFGGSYITPFAIAMNATATQVGILGAIVATIPSMSQLFSSKLIEKYSRKKVILSAILIQILLWIPIILTGVLYFKNKEIAVTTLMILSVLFFITSGIIYPAWFSLMGSLVPPKKRGLYFSRRTRVFQTVGVITMISAAIILDSVKKIGSIQGDMIVYTILGFGILFTLAMTSRLISFFQLSRHYEPKLKIPKKEHETLIEFIKNITSTPFGRFTLFKTALIFTVGIASPFFVVYMLRDLGFSYTWFMIITVAAIISQIIFLKIIGKVSDRFGNILLTKLSASFVGLVPLLWALSAVIPDGIGKKIYLILFVQVVNGIGWASIAISTNNYVYDAIKKERQGYAIAYYSLFTGTSFLLGALLGSQIVKAEFFSINIIIILFLISGVGRCLVALLGTKYLKEIREVKKFDPNYIIHNFHPIKEAINEIHHINHLGAKAIHHI